MERIRESFVEEKTTNDTRLIDIKEVSQLIGCSTRHVTRLEKKGILPPSFKLGRLKRWNKSKIENWIECGCPKTTMGSAEELMV